VAAVIRPVGVQQPQLRFAGIAALPLEMSLGVFQVRPGHGQAHPAPQRFQARLIAVPEAVQHGHRRGLRQGRGQGFGPGGAHLAAVHGVDEVGPHPRPVGLRQRPLQHEHLGAGHGGPGAMGEQLHRLGRAVRPLVVLARQVGHRQRPFIRRQGQRFVVDLVQGRLREDRPPRRRPVFLAQPLGVVAHHQPQVLQRRDAHHVAQIVQQVLGLHGASGLLLDKETADGAHGDLGRGRRALGPHSRVASSPEPPGRRPAEQASS